MIEYHSRNSGLRMRAVRAVQGLLMSGHVSEVSTEGLVIPSHHHHDIR